MKLHELIDLEVQLLHDEQQADGREAAGIVRRDRSIGHRIATELQVPENEASARLARSRPLRHAVCGHWLSHLPAAIRDKLPGRRIEHGYRVVGWLLVGVFTMVGIGTATTALSSRGNEPVNVLVFLVVFCALQMALLALLPALLLYHKLRGGGSLSWLQGLVVRLGRARWVDRLSRSTGVAATELPGLLDGMRAKQAIYGRVQQWLLFTLVQRMAVAFNCAALLTSLYMVTFHDLAFCWSTTLDLQATELHRGLSLLGLPWSFLDTCAPPSLSAIEVSRFVPAKGGYVHDHVKLAETELAQLRRTWWPFLVTALTTWGLLPRLLALGLGAWRTGAASRAIPLRHMAVQHLFERLFPPAAGWQGPSPDAVRGDAPADQRVAPAPLRTEPALRCAVVCWGSLSSAASRAAEHVSRRFGLPVSEALPAGLADLAGDQETLSRLQRSRPARVVVVLPEGQQPTKDVMRLLAALRDGLGGACELVVGLLADDGTEFTDVESDELATWRTRLAAEGDPYLTAQPMGLHTSTERPQP
ncbi:MAG: DUF2868 domain-containing protein [Planctomycetes bacterium]|nr:DUF2868 domain-containing protein [Planctomycetota bacterium]